MPENYMKADTSIDCEALSLSSGGSDHTGRACPECSLLIERNNLPSSLRGYVTQGGLDALSDGLCISCRPEMHEEHARFFRQHVAVQCSHLNVVLFEC